MALIVAFEGMSGAGKTTTIRALAPALIDDGFRFLVLNEKEEEPLRSWVIGWHSRPASAKAFSREDVEAVASCRAEIHARLRDTIQNNDLIIFDRSVFTSVVYQASAELPLTLIWTINTCHQLLLPQRVFLFTGDASVCHQRIMDRLQQRTHYRLPATVESAEHIAEIGRRYELIRGLMEPLTELDAAQPLAEKVQIIHDSILTMVRSFRTSPP